MVSESDRCTQVELLCITGRSKRNPVSLHKQPLEYLKKMKSSVATQKAVRITSWSNERSLGSVMPRDVDDRGVKRWVKGMPLIRPGGFAMLKNICSSRGVHLSLRSLDHEGDSDQMRKDPNFSNAISLPSCFGVKSEQRRHSQ